MQRISIEQGLRALQRFLVAEWRLALPVALAFHALPVLVLSVLVQPIMRKVVAAMDGTIEGMRLLGEAMPGWVLPAMIVVGLLTVLGALALTALALLPRISVGEAIATGFRRLPIWVGAAAIGGVAAFVVLILLGILFSALPAGGNMLIVVTFAMMVALSLYLILLMPLIVDRPVGPLDALRTGLAAYRGQVMRTVAGMILFLAGCWIAAIAVQTALGSVILLLARAIGAGEAGAALVGVLAALVSALEWGCFYLLVALLYRQHHPRG